MNRRLAVAGVELLAAAVLSLDLGAARLGYPAAEFAARRAAQAMQLGKGTVVLFGRDEPLTGIRFRQDNDLHYSPPSHEQAGPPRPATEPQAPKASAVVENDLDAFMARVLERRDEAWRRLHDYVLDETEQFRILGPGEVPLHGMKREFTWYVRDGYLVRSPLRFDGVELSQAERLKYEAHWLDEEKKREANAAKQGSKGASSQAGEPPARPETGQAETAQAEREAAGDEASLQQFVDQRGEPRFISEAYFLRFRFEPGNYYFAGRETLDGRPVVKVEYYPTKLFRNDEKGSEGTDTDSARQGRKRRQKEHEDDYSRQFNKVALVTLWVDPAAYQIVRYTFDNMDFGFLPGRWLVRLDEIRVSMTMGRVLDGVWLPAAIDARGGLSLANGGYQFQYARRFANYRKAETGARIRSMIPRDR